MALLHVNFDGASIGKRTEMNVLIPDGRRGPLPVLYLLHGLSDAYADWQRKSRIEWYVRDLPLIVAMPDGARSWYLNTPLHGDYEDHIVRDVIGFVDRTFQTIRARRGRAIAGLSMGGYGAVQLGMKHPGKFTCICAHSGAFLLEAGRPEPPFAEMMPYFRKRANQPGALAKGLLKRRTRPALRMDCGREDFLIENNRRFHAHLKRLGYAHEYEEFDGAHDWDYWDAHVRDTLRFVMQHVAKA